MKWKVKTNSAGFRQRHSFGSMNDRVRDVQCGKKKASWFNLSPSSGSHLLVYLPSLPSVKTLRMYPHKTQEKKNCKKKKIKKNHCSSVGRLFRKNSTPTANVFTANSPT